MRLYYYTKLHHGLSTIRDKRIKIALYNSLNDPFDFLGLATEDKVHRRQLNALRKELSKDYGIICLSETWKEPLMWGHYAESHKGICLGFEVKAGDYQRIKYRAERPKLEDFNKTSVADLTEEDKADISSRKFDSWEYEREWRRIVALEEPDYVDGNYYLPFDDRMQLKTVLIGTRAAEVITDAQIKRILDENEDVRIAFTRPAYLKFEVVVNRVLTEKRVPDGRRTLVLPVPKSLEFQHVLETSMMNMLETIHRVNKKMIEEKILEKFAKK